MKLLKYKEQFGFRSILAPARPNDIEEAEDELEKKLPIEYLEFLKEWNGGIFLDELPPSIELDGYFNNVTILYGIGPYAADYVHLLGERSQEGYGFAKRVPSRFLAIGEGGPMQKICISIEGMDNGKIYYWEPIELREDDVPTMDYVTLIGENFLDFWNKLIKGGTSPDQWVDE